MNDVHMRIDSTLLCLIKKTVFTLQISMQLDAHNNIYFISFGFYLYYKHNKLHATRREEMYLSISLWKDTEGSKK